MSALFTGQGAIFLTESGTRSGAVAGVYVDESVGSIVLLVGNMAPSLVFAAPLTGIFVLAGDIAPSLFYSATVTGILNLAGDLPAVPVFGGDLSSGGVVIGSLYGKGTYGLGLYSQVSVWDLAGDLSVTPVLGGALAGVPLLAGDLAPSVTIAGVVLGTFALIGDLAPAITINGDLFLTAVFAGDIPLDISFTGELELIISMVGDLPLAVSLDADMHSGPLWVLDPDLAEPWVPNSPCVPSIWTPVSSDVPVWTAKELCDG